MPNRNTSGIAVGESEENQSTSTPNSLLNAESTGPKSTSNIKRKDMARTTTDNMDGRKKITRYALVPASCLESKNAIINESGKIMKFCTGKHNSELRRLF